MTQKIEAPERANARIGILGGTEGLVGVAVTPTQVRKPWRATVRTVFAGLVAFCALLPFIIEATHIDPEVYPWVAGILAIAGVVTRVMAVPQVEVFLRQYLPFLSASGKQNAFSKDEAGVSTVELCLIVLTGLAILAFCLWMLGGHNAR